VKIAVLVPRFPVLSQTFVLNQITGHLDLGHDVHVVALSPSSDPTRHPAVEEYGLMERTTYLDPRPGTSQTQCALRTMRRLLRRGVSTLLRVCAAAPRKHGLPTRRALCRVGALLDDEWLQLCPVVHCHFANAGVGVATALKAMYGARLLLTMHGYDLRMATERGPEAFRDVFAAVDLFLSISDYTTAHLVDWGVPQERIVKHPAGIDLAPFHEMKANGRARSPSDPLHVLTVARLVEEKGLDHAIEAIELLKRRDPDVQLVYEIIGGGHLEQHLAQTIRARGLSECVRLLGPKPSDAVRAAMTRADIFLLPSVAEITPVVLMEAQAAGLAVVATDVGAVTEVVSADDTAYVVPARDVEALADALCRLIDDPSGRSAMGIRGRQRAWSKFDVRKLNARLVQIYEDVIEGRLPADA